MLQTNHLCGVNDAALRNANGIKKRSTNGYHLTTVGIQCHTLKHILIKLKPCYLPHLNLCVNTRVLLRPHVTAGYPGYYENKRSE